MEKKNNQLAKYERMVEGFSRRNRLDAALDTAAILAAAVASLPAVLVMLPLQHC